MAFTISWKAQARLQAAPGLAAGTLRPQDLGSLYGLEALYRQGYYGQSETIGFVEFATPAWGDDADFWSRHSLQSRLNTPAVTTHVDRAPGDPTALAETDLDLQYAGALAPGARLRVYIVPDSGAVDAFAGALYDALQAAAADGVHIVSISLGTSEKILTGCGSISAPASGRSWTDPAAFCDDLDRLVREAGLAVFAASGDSGAYGGLPFGDPTAQPIWPALQSSVIAVGGTQLRVPGDTASGEDAWGGQSLDPNTPGFSRGNALPTASGGGGVSTMVPTPRHQRTQGFPGRATPDVAAFAGPLLIVDGGQEVSIWGTSAAAPVAAAMAALTHQATGRLPDAAALYAAAHDITSGNNWNNRLLVAGLRTFYTANPGYDLCTGAGRMPVG